MKAHFPAFPYKWISGYEVWVVRDSSVRYNKFPRPKWFKTCGFDLMESYLRIYNYFVHVNSSQNKRDSIERSKDIHYFIFASSANALYVFQLSVIRGGRWRLRRRKTFCDGNGNIYKRFPLGKEARSFYNFIIEGNFTCETTFATV